MKSETHPLYNYEEIRELIENPTHREITLAFPAIGKCRRYVKSEQSEEIVACFEVQLKPGYFVDNATNRVYTYRHIRGHQPIKKFV